MHALPSHPKHPLLVGLLVLALALLMLAAAAPELGTLDFSIGGAGEATPASTPAAPVDPTPAWTTEPLAPPVETLRGY